MKQVAGTVLHGEEKGRMLGFPTANVKPGGKTDIAPGIYSGKTVLLDGREFQSALYVREDGIVETHLLDFRGDVYGQNISILVFEKIRENMKFKNSDEAKKQIAADIASVREYFRKQK